MVGRSRVELHAGLGGRRAAAGCMEERAPGKRRGEPLQLRSGRRSRVRPFLARIKRTLVSAEAPRQTCNVTPVQMLWWLFCCPIAERPRLRTPVGPLSPGSLLSG